MSEGLMEGPSGEEVEVGVVGALLLDGALAGPLCVAAGLTVEAFVFPGTRTVFEAAMGVWERTGWVDAISVMVELRARGTLEKVGGEKGAGTYLDELVDRTPTAAHAGFYVDALLNAWLCRRAADAARTTLQEALKGNEGSKVVGQAVERFVALGAGQDEEKGLVALLDASMGRWRDAKDKKRPAIGLETPWALLTEKLCGLEPGVTVLAAPPSGGKTTLEGQLAVHLASQGVGVLRFTNDATREELVERMAALYAEISLPRLKGGFVGDSHFATLEEFREVLREWPMWIDDRTFDIRAICTKARMMVRRHGVKLITLDYIQNVQAGDMGKQQFQKTALVTHASALLKCLSLELKVPILVLSQLNRESRKEGTREPQLTDLRDSGAIEQDAQKVLMLWPDEWNAKAEEAAPGVGRHKRAINCGLKKNKNGEQDEVVKLWMYPPYFKMVEPDDQVWTDPGAERGRWR